MASGEPTTCSVSFGAFINNKELTNNVRIGHQSNGYTDGEIGIEWIKLFNKYTVAKAAGRWRLLLVDGHNSHYTVGLLQYARDHKIHVLCYPSHSTHVYQGVDVVIFSVLKRAWSEFRDAYERDGYGTVKKEIFLAIYAKAHNKALTKDNILAVFRKTGVSPFNPAVVTAEIMALSISTSTSGTLPLRPPSPILVLEDMIHRDIAHRTASGRMQLAADIEQQDKDTPRTETNPNISTNVHAAVSSLSSTSASFLTSQSPIHSSSRLPEYQPYTISPFKTTRYLSILEERPLTNLEQELQVALIEAEERDNRRKHAMVEMQAMMILNGAYVTRVQQQLHAKENHESKGKKRKAFGDGLPKLLDGDEFFRKAQETEAEMKKEAETAGEKRRAREARSQALKEWKQLEEERKSRNKEKGIVFRAAVKAWKKEVHAAKAEERQPRWSRPKQADWFEHPIPKPLPQLAETEERNSGDNPMNDDDDDGAGDTGIFISD